jgi:hypothetical protein
VLAESPINGTWKVDPATAKWSDKPVEANLAGGRYDCVTCVPRYQIAADGRYQKRPVTGVDETSVQVISDSIVKFASRRDGQLISEGLMTVSADGKSRMIESVDYAPNGMVNRSAVQHRRVGPAPAGAHAISGKWVMERVASANDEQMLFTYALADNTLRLSTPDGYSYAAPIGGAPVKVAGDRGGGTVQIRRISDNAIEESNRRGDGTLVSVAVYTASADGRLAIRTENKLTGAVETVEAVRQ